MKTVSSIILIFTFTGVAALSHAGKVYKWIDDEGVPQYTDQAPTDRTYTVLETHGAPKSAAAALKKRAEALEANSQPEGPEVDFEAQKLEREKQAKVRAENCKNAQANLQTMQQNARVRILDDNGEFRFLSEEERQAEMQRAENVIENNCGSEQS